MGRSASRSRRWSRRLAATVVVAAVVAPAVHGRDDFPLSTYPMYASARPEVAALATVRGVTGSGERRALSLAAIADTDDPLIAEAAVEGAIRRGASLDLCRRVAARVPEDVVQVEVVTERHDVVRHVTGRSSLVSRDVHATCEVTG